MPCPACDNELDTFRDESGRERYYCSVCDHHLSGNELLDLERFKVIFRDGRKEIVVTVVDTRTGELFRIDRLMARMGHMRKRVKAWAEAVEQSVSGQFHLVMVTLTYGLGLGNDEADAELWKANHIRGYELALRKDAGPNIVGYAWVAEMQARGVIHYHLLAWVRHGYFVPMPDKSGMWSHGMSKTEEARTPFYILKYAQKGADGGPKLPKGAHMFAVWVAKGVLTAAMTYQFRKSALPNWLADLLTFGEELFPVREKGGGWKIGQFWVGSPYVASFA